MAIVILPREKPIHIRKHLNNKEQNLAQGEGVLSAYNSMVHPVLKILGIKDDDSQ